MIWITKKSSHNQKQFATDDFSVKIDTFPSKRAKKSTMSGTDETDRAKNKEFLSSEQIAMVKQIKSNMDAAHDHSNGDTLPVNGEISISVDDKNKQINATTAGAAAMSGTEPTIAKPSTPSGWVQFDNEDDSDKVSFSLKCVFRIWTVVKSWAMHSFTSSHRE